jgi:uncharacterized membrane protein YhfC
MVSTLSIFFMVMSLIIIFGFPLALVIWFYKKEKISLIAVLVGALVFLVSQLLVRIPLLNLFANTEIYRQMAENLVFIAFFLAFTAGLFEEVGRWIGFKYFLKRHLSWKNGVAFGIGHGGFEAIALVGLSYINNLVYSIMINSGSFAEVIAPQLGPEMSNYIVDQLVGLPSYIFLLAGFERVFTILVHIALSLIVLYGVMNKKPVYLLYAILLHGVINLPAVIFPGLGLNILYVELYLLIVAVFCYIYIWRSKGSFLLPGQE